MVLSVKGWCDHAARSAQETSGVFGFESQGRTFPPSQLGGVCAVEGVIFLSHFSAWQNFLVETSVYMCFLLHVV